MHHKLQKAGPNSRLAHVGNDPMDYFGFINPPVVHASTVLFPDYETMKTHNQKYTYGTRGTSTTDALATILNDLENSAGTIIVPSGLAAISVPMLAFAKTGDHCLIVDSVYAPTRIFADTMLTRLGLEVEYFSPDIGHGIADLLRDNTSMVVLEAPGSNTFEMLDVGAVVKAARQSEAIVMMDNTWATPLFFKPLDHGVDISIHALTKYPGGHSDLLLGSVSANARSWKQLLATQGHLGICAQGDDCYAVVRGLRTMGLRLARHEKSAIKVAQWLTTQKQVAQVLHPALPDHPGHDIWKRDFSGSSGLFSFVLKDANDTQVGNFLDALQFFGLGYSWGGFASLASAVDTRDRTICHAPTSGRLIRLFVGLEDVEDLIKDVDQALMASGVT